MTCNTEDTTFEPPDPGEPAVDYLFGEQIWQFEPPTDLEEGEVFGEDGWRFRITWLSDDRRKAHVYPVERWERS